MLCPKCGQEYEGSQCPNCQEPEIIVNNTDYQKRKEAYEKKQAEKKSASSRSEALKPESAAADKVSEEALTETGKDNTKESAYEEIDYLGIMKKVCDTGRGIAGNAAGELSKRKGFFKKHFKLLLIAVVVLSVFVGAGFGIYRLATRKNYVLYMSSNQKIYNAAGLESNYVCDNAQAVFAADNKTFYTPEFPAEIKQEEVTNVLASDNGEYFAAAVYQEDSAQYALYTWKAEENHAVQICKNTYDKDISYVTNKGKVIYTDIEVINDEGAVRNVQLYLYNPSGELVLVEQQLKEFFVYAGQEKIVCCNKENVLYVYNYNTLAKSAEISDEVKGIYAESAQTDNFYTAKADIVNTSKSADAFLYSDNGEWYYYDLSEQKAKFVTQETASNVEFVYEEKGGYLYLLLSDKISYAELTQDGIKGLKVIDELPAADYVYLAAENTLLYTNVGQELCYSEKGRKNVIDSGVISSSLSSVGNTQTGFTYIKGGIQYYCSTVKSAAVKMHEMSEGADTSATLFYKNKLYFYDAEGQLYSCQKNGKGLDKVGEVSRFWLGTKYQ